MHNVADKLRPLVPEHYRPAGHPPLLCLADPEPADHLERAGRGPELQPVPGRDEEDSPDLQDHEDTQVWAQHSL